MKTKEERKTLEDLIKQSPSSIDDNVLKKEDNVPELRPEPTMDIDFEKLKDDCDKEAKAMILNSVEFVLPLDMIEGNAYLKNKIDVDAMSLSGMIYQLRCNEAMQKAIMEQVKQGAVHARNFEVFSGMSKTIGDLNKQLLQTVEAIQSTYKALKDSIKEQRTEALGPQQNSVSGMITTGDGGVVTRGTKELINQVKLLKNGNGGKTFIDDAQLIPDLPLPEADQPQQ